MSGTIGSFLPMVRKIRINFRFRLDSPILKVGSPPKEQAVSPVIGIMLMLIITVILAAIISGYVGGMSETKSKPPQLVLQTDAWKSSSNLINVSMSVISAGDGIPTRDLKIITSWKSVSNSGGNITIPGSLYPQGRIPSKNGLPEIEDFGNYTLFGGTNMFINTSAGDQVFFGTSPDNIDKDTILTIKIVHVPSQATIYSQELILGDNS